MRFLQTYSIVLYPIAFLIAFSLSVYYITILPLFVAMVLMLIASKLQKQF